ncbi:MAG: hypothetical protein ACI8Y7_000900 [Candidatus Woesearchaeota archaeon]
MKDKTLTVFEDAVKRSFDKVRCELTEHLDAINDNTSDTHAVQGHCSELELKIEKLNEKLDEILMHIQGKQQDAHEQYKIQPLTLREQEVFVCLYTAPDNKKSTYLDISHKIALPVTMIAELVTSLIGKGVPIIKRMKEDTFHLELDSEFKIAQTKHNILKLQDQIVAQIIGGQ